MQRVIFVILIAAILVAASCSVEEPIFLLEASGGGFYSDEKLPLEGVKVGKSVLYCFEKEELCFVDSLIKDNGYYLKTGLSLKDVKRRLNLKGADEKEVGGVIVVDGKSRGRSVQIVDKGEFRLVGFPCVLGSF